MTAKEQKQLRESLDAFSALTGVPVTLYAPDGAERESFLAETKACRLFRPYESTGECGRNRQFSLQLAYELGEAYLYECPSGFVHIAAPVIANGALDACAVAGPLLMGELDEGMLDKIAASNGFTAVQLARSAALLSGLPRYSPGQVQRISTLFFSAVLSGSRSWQEYERRSAQHQRQLAAGERIQKRKTAPATSDGGVTVAERSERLLLALRRGERETALQTADGLFGELLLVEGGNLDRVKLRLFEVYVAIARAASQQGLPLRRAFSGEGLPLGALSASDSVEELGACFRELTTYFCDELFGLLPAVPDQMQQALAYIAAHYAEKLTLGAVAEKLFIGESTLSRLFQQELGASFTNHLNRVRIERSRELLEHTAMSLLDISALVGFADQSYFTKVFQRYVGVNPRQYRRQLSAERKELS